MQRNTHLVCRALAAIGLFTLLCTVGCKQAPPSGQPSTTSSRTTGQTTTAPTTTGGQTNPVVSQPGKPVTNSPKSTNGSSAAATTASKKGGTVSTVQAQGIPKWYSPGQLRVSSLQEARAEEPKSGQVSAFISVYIPNKAAGHTAACQMQLNTLTGEIFCINHLLTQKLSSRLPGLTPDLIAPTPEWCKNQRFFFFLNDKTEGNGYYYDLKMDQLHIMQGPYMRDWETFSLDMSEFAHGIYAGETLSGVPYHDICLVNFTADTRKIITKNADGSQRYCAYGPIAFSPQSRYIAYWSRTDSGAPGLIAVWDRRTDQTFDISSNEVIFSGDETRLFYPDANLTSKYWQRNISTGAVTLAFEAPVNPHPLPTLGGTSEVVQPADCYSQLLTASHSGNTQVCMTYSNIYQPAQGATYLFVQNQKVKLQKENMGCWLTDPKQQYFYSYSLQNPEVITVTCLETLAEFTVPIDDLTALRAVQMAYGHKVGVNLYLSPAGDKIYLSYYGIAW